MKRYVHAAQTSKTYTRRPSSLAKANHDSLYAYEGQGFNEDQMDEIREGLESGLDVSIYADPKFDSDQMRHIRQGLEAGVDVSIYADPKFDWSQMWQIREGLNSGVDVSIYADPKFNWYQMLEIRRGLESGLDASVYADPKFDDGQMMQIRYGLKSGVDVSLYADPKFDWLRMKQIREGLESGSDVSKYADSKQSNGKSYPTEAEIDRLEDDPSNQSVENKYYDQCIDAISKGLEGHQWESGTLGIDVFDYDEESDEYYDVAFLYNDYIKELELDCLRASDNWADFQNDLAGRVKSEL